MHVSTRLPVLATLLALGSFASTALASEPAAPPSSDAAPQLGPPASKVSVGLHTGLSARVNRDQGYAIFTMPLGLDLRYRASKHLTVAALGEAGPLVHFGGYRARMGGDVQAHFAPAGRIDPWAGVGLAATLYRLHVIDLDVVTKHEELGVEPFATAGFDVRPTRDLSLGLFANASAERYVTRLDRPNASVTDTSFHPYVTLGAHVALAL